MVPPAGSTHLNEVHPELPVITGHPRQFSLGAKTARIRTEFVPVRVVESDEVVCGLAPRAGLPSGDTVIAGGP